MANAAELAIIIKARDEASRALGQVDKAAGGLGKTLKTGLVVGGAAALVGLGALAVGLKSVVGEAAEAQKVAAQTEAVLKSTGGVSGMTAKSVGQLADSLARVVPVDDEVIQATENMLLTFTRVGKDVFPAATEAALDMATALGTDPVQASIQLGKALNDPIQGVTALRRVGVQLTDAQQEQVKAFMAVNDIAGAQKIILQELQTEFGGSARAAGETFAGKMAILQTQIGNVKEAIGAALIPVLTDLATRFSNFLAGHQEEIERFAELFGEKVVGAIQAVVDFFDRHEGTIKEFFRLFTVGLETLKPVFDFIINNKVALIAAITAIGVAILVVLGPGAAAILAIAGLITLIGLVRDNWDSLKAKTEEVWNAIKGFLSANWQEIASIAALFLLGPAGLVVLFTTNAFGIRDKVVEAFNAMKDGVLGAWGGLKDGIAGILNAVGGAVESGVNAMIDAINRLLDGLRMAQDVAGWLNPFGGGGPAIPNIPRIDIPTIGGGPTGPIGPGLIFGPIGGFQMGGIVPGPIGAPRLIMAHGGETVLPTQGGGGRGASLKQTIYIDRLIIEGDPKEALAALGLSAI